MMLVKRKCTDGVERDECEMTEINESLSNHSNQSSDMENNGSPKPLLEKVADMTMDIGDTAIKEAGKATRHVINFWSDFTYLLF